MDGGDVTDHIAKVLEITEWIKMPNVENNELRLHVFLKSLSGDAKTWWNNEINETTITWSELNDKFFHKYYPLSHTYNSKIPDDMDNSNDEEFVTVGPRKVSNVERTPGSMSCIHHELFNRKDRGWTEPYGDLAETMIWYILKKTRVELIRAF
ncbi:hypothetical protein Tco_0105093 [Tanacetum coccineum]